VNGSDIAISVRNLSKAYTISHQTNGLRGRRPTFRDTITDFLSDPFKKTPKETFWALKDVSFDVKKGDVVGIIGRNGAGKSTLLKILSRITKPTSGEIDVYGRIGSLLEVGTGFHPELSGRENIFLNGAILGMTRPEIRKQFDAIVGFAEVEHFLDTPVKRYSSGMYVRLAFAVAAHLNPEILVVDEVLAVGDASFQKKCLGKMKDAAANDGRTVLFVSHNMAAVASLCNAGILMQQGRIMFYGSSGEAIAGYNAFQDDHDTKNRNLSSRPRKGSGKIRFSRVELQSLTHDDKPATHLQTGGNIRVTLGLTAVQTVGSNNIAIIISDMSEVRLIDVNTALKGEFISLAAGESQEVTFTIREILLKPGTYKVGLWAGRGGIEDNDIIDDATTFAVEQNPSTSNHTEVFPGPYQCRFSLDVADITASASLPPLLKAI
jgi:lipopolysaccharide transport system ATP-binding protein